MKPKTTWYLIVAITFIIYMAVAGCKTSKDVTSVQSHIAMKESGDLKVSGNSQLKNDITNEQTSETVTEEEFDTTVNVTVREGDSSKTTAVPVKGKRKTTRREFNRQQDKSTLSQDVDLSKKNKVEAEASENTTSRQVDRTSLPWWWFIPAGIAVLIVVRYRKKIRGLWG